MKVAIYGDIHLQDKNYGVHIDYAKESLEIYNKIYEICEENKVDVVVGAGDFSYKRFLDLGYRLKVEEILSKFSKLTNGKHMMLKGNHDIASYGITERDYYIEKGLLKECESIVEDKVEVRFTDYGQIGSQKAFDENGKFHIDVIHDLVDFNKNQMNGFGKAIVFEDTEAFKNTDMIVAGHIHKCRAIKETVNNKQRIISYLGCPTRPAYMKDDMDSIGQVLIFDTDSGEMGMVQFQLPDESEIFNKDFIDERQEKKESKIDRARISEIVCSIADKTSEVSTNNIEEKIRGMETISSAYREKAIELIKKAREK